jgi:hypothetical protein
MAPKRLAKLRKDNPALAERTDVQLVGEDIDTYAALNGVSQSEGGAVLLKALNRDIASAIQAIVGGYKTLPEIELRALGATLEARIQLAQTLNRAPQNLQLAEEALKELTG